MSKLWQKNSKVATSVEKFTIGNDQSMDLYLAAYDVLGSIAHTTMLAEVGMLTIEEQIQLKNALIEIYETIESGNFSLEPGVEDIHSQVEILLTQKLGDIGKKIHSARSRNDQVLVDLKLFLRSSSAPNLTLLYGVGYIEVQCKSAYSTRAFSKIATLFLIFLISFIPLLV